VAAPVRCSWQGIDRSLYSRISKRPGTVKISDYNYFIIHSFIHSRIYRRPFNKSTQRRPQPSHGNTDQS